MIETQSAVIWETHFIENITVQWRKIAVEFWYIKTIGIKY